MIWKLKASPVFWIPEPYTGQNLMEIAAYKFDKAINPTRRTLTDPDTLETYTIEILDYFGPYDIEQIPDHLAASIGGRDMTGHILAYFLRKKKEEFKECKKVLFLQVNPLTNG